MTAVMVAAGCNKPAQEAKAGVALVESAPVSVDAATVGEQPMPVYATFSGQLVADKVSTIAAGAAGKVLQTFVERGDFVQEGQLLARTDARTTRAMAAEANAQVESARAQAALAKTECDRNKQLFEKGVISKAEYDRVSATCTTTQFTTQAAEARRSNIAITLSDSEIRAPFAGFIVERFVSVGEYVAPASRVATIVAVDPLRAQLTVPESFASSISMDQKVEIRLSNDPGAAALSGTVRYVSPEIRQASRDLVVEAIIPNADKKLKPGTFVVARVSLGDKASAVVPKSAVWSDGATSRLFAVVNGQLEERIVHVGETVSDKVAVLDGVKSGEKIVASVSAELRDGQKVR
jgi:membrane fusion protein (multidrug efflux system)